MVTEGVYIPLQNLRDALDCIYDAKVPKTWGKVMYAPIHHTSSLEYLEFPCRSHGIRRPLVSGTLSCWREMHSSVAGCLKADPTASG